MDSPVSTEKMCFSKITRGSLFMFFFLICTSMYAQTGEIRGRVKDKATAFVLKKVIVSISDGAGHTFEHKVSTNTDGDYVFQSLTPGKYDLRFDLKGYKSEMIKGILVSSDKATFSDMELQHLR